MCAYTRRTSCFSLYSEDVYLVDRFHISALHDGRCTACCEAHTNFVDEPACLIADNVRKEANKTSPLCTDHRCVENAVPLHADIPRTGGRGSDSRFEAVLQEYLQFPYE
jgi:hypothetical protein